MKEPSLKNHFVDNDKGKGLSKEKGIKIFNSFGDEIDVRHS